MRRGARTRRWSDSLAPSVEVSTQSIESVSLSASVKPTAALPNASRRDPVWLCVYFPGLPLQALADQCQRERANVICDPQQAHRIVALDRAAQAHGIVAGQSLKAALALCADLHTIDRQPERELALLEQLGQHMLKFTSRVSLQPAQALLLELRASLRLFSGIGRLCEAITQRLEKLGFYTRQSVAPSAQAAYWLARAGQHPDPVQVVRDGRDAPSFLHALNALPITCTDWPHKTQRMLQEMGVHSLADCRRLPRAGLNRRFGGELLCGLAQAFGELPEVRKGIKEQEYFQALLNLDAEIENVAGLLPACEALLAQLAAFLRARQSKVFAVYFSFHPWRGEALNLSLQLTGGGHALEHWLPLLNARIERCVLQSPAVAVSLRADTPHPCEGASALLALPQEKQLGATATQTLFALLDRLSARLGDSQVYALRHVAEHRPEYASQRISAKHIGAHCAALPSAWQLHAVPVAINALQRRCELLLQRPLWLLAEPLALHEQADVLYYEGALQLRAGPERIESGWWDEHASARDYFVAENPSGMRLWVFRTQPLAASVQQVDVDAGAMARWWLHGIFS